MLVHIFWSQLATSLVAVACHACGLVQFQLKVILTVSKLSQCTSLRTHSVVRHFGLLLRPLIQGDTQIN